MGGVFGRFRQANTVCRSHAVSGFRLRELLIALVALAPPVIRCRLLYVLGFRRPISDMRPSSRQLGIPRGRRCNPLVVAPAFS